MAGGRVGPGVMRAGELAVPAPPAAALGRAGPRVMRVGELAISLTGSNIQRTGPAPQLGSRIELVLVARVAGKPS